MSGIDGINGNYDYRPLKNEFNIDLNDIDLLFETTKEESDRSDFISTFTTVDYQKSKYGKAFLEGLIDNKKELSDKLNLSEEQYDILACCALGLASQETGMGLEKGYVEENTGLGKIGRNILKFIDKVFYDGGSASSGLTQIKINDFMKSDKLSTEEKNILYDFGIETRGLNGNNLFQNPDKSAIATIVVLYSIYEKYGEYLSRLQDKHTETGNTILNNSLQESYLIETSNDYIDKTLNFYEKLTDEEKTEFRTAFKYWFLAENDSTIGNKKRKKDLKYNEEYQLNELNNILKNNNAGFNFNSDTIQYIRYALTEKGQEMNLIQFLAYGWNNGTEETSNQLDRLLYGRIMNLFPAPEDYGMEQYSYNVSSLAEKYAQQSYSGYDIQKMSDIFFND